MTDGETEAQSGASESTCPRSPAGESTKIQTQKARLGQWCLQGMQITSRLPPFPHGYSDAASMDGLESPHFSDKPTLFLPMQGQHGVLRATVVWEIAVSLL